MHKIVLIDEEGKGKAARYQAARKAAHRLADRTKENHVVLDDQFDTYKVVPESEKGEAQAWYTARPGTVTYTQYLEECDARGIAKMSKKDWIASGRLSVEGILVARFGPERAAEMQSKTKHRIPKAKREIAISDKGSDQMPSRGSTRKVWEIADSLVVDGVSGSRAAIIEACISAGVNKGTASTQYSAWVKARREAK